MRLKQVLPLRFTVDLGVMAIKEYFPLFRSPELEPHNQMQFSVIPRTLHFFFFGGLTHTAEYIVEVLYAPLTVRTDQAVT